MEISSENLVRQGSEVEDVPKWLTNDFVEKTLRNFFKNDGIKVRTFTLKASEIQRF